MAQPLPLKDGLVAFHDSHPELVDVLVKLTAVPFSTYVRGAIEVPVSLGGGNGISGKESNRPPGRGGKRGLISESPDFANKTNYPQLAPLPP
jgi:hypothetical protein